MCREYIEQLEQDEAELASRSDEASFRQLNQVRIELANLRRLNVGALQDVSAEQENSAVLA